MSASILRSSENKPEDGRCLNSPENEEKSKLVRRSLQEKCCKYDTTVSGRLFFPAVVQYLGGEGVRSVIHHIYTSNSCRCLCGINGSGFSREHCVREKRRSTAPAVPAAPRQSTSAPRLGFFFALSSSRRQFFRAAHTFSEHTRLH